MEKFGFNKIKIFFIIEGFIYICFLGLDITRQGYALSGILKFVGIFLCACLVFSEKNPVSIWKQKLFQWSYIFLVISDIFLLFTSYYALGLITFIAVQMIYFYYLLEGNRNKLIQQSIWRFFLFLGIAYLIYFLHIEIDITLLLAIFYFIQFMSNVLLSIKNCKKKYVCFLLGIILFFLCDINVGIYQAGLYVTNKWVESIAILSQVLMWVFYLPGQVLIAYSAISEK